YSFQTWGETQADRYLDQLESGILSLRDAPERGRARQEFRNHAYFSMRIREHVVFYTFDEEEVCIRRVLHKARDYERHL
ncbi:MAG: type II toxin-antitoxin system RelE/ParE family toxin, partial [Myxococcota bacterium]